MSIEVFSKKVLACKAFAAFIAWKVSRCPTVKNGGMDWILQVDECLSKDMFVAVQALSEILVGACNLEEGYVVKVCKHDEMNLK